MTTALIVGQPNSGKTEFFNALTHSHAAVGNWSGVTVDIESSTLRFEGVNRRLSLGPTNNLEDENPSAKSIVITDSPGIYTLAHKPENEDEKITYFILTHNKPDLLINVVDATQLERQLILTTELIELKIPMLIVLNKVNLAEKRGIFIDIKALDAALACKIFVFNSKKDIEEIKKNLFLYSLQLSKPTPPALPLSANLQKDHDLELIKARHTFVKNALSSSSIHSKQDNITKNLDNILLNRYLSLPLFFIMMYCLFLFAISFGSLLQGLLENVSNTIFIHTPTKILNNLNAPIWLKALLIDGFGKGINTTISFIPVLYALYLGLSFLEGSGYMSRAAFIMDRFMRTIGLPGKAFVPLIIGFGCNVPAILATRTLENKKERLLTILLAPFMSCSARLTIYAVFTNAFFPNNGQNIIFSLYILGIAAAIFTAFIFKKILSPYNLTPLILELPTYQCPAFIRLLKMSFKRLSLFLKRAAQVIIPVCIVLSLFNILPAPYHKAVNLLAYIGQLITPIFAPIGLTTDNWPATVGLFTGVLAKEVVIGSLNTLYQQTDNLGLSQIMQQKFPDFTSVYAYLTFILLYLPCVSTMSAIKQETTAKFMWIAIFWSFSCAYILSAFIYQIGSFHQHPVTSTGWLCVCILLFAASLYIIKKTCIQQAYSQQLDAASNSKQTNKCNAHNCAEICNFNEMLD